MKILNLGGTFYLESTGGIPDVVGIYIDVLGSCQTCRIASLLHFWQGSVLPLAYFQSFWQKNILVTFFGFFLVFSHTLLPFLSWVNSWIISIMGVFNISKLLHVVFAGSAWFLKLLIQYDVTQNTNQFWKFIWLEN